MNLSLFAQALLSCLCVSPLLSPLVYAQNECPNVAGHYRVAEAGSVLGDALKVWGAEMAGFSGSEVKISGDANAELSVFWKSGSDGVMSSRPNKTWRLNVEYRCQDGWLIFKRTEASQRRTEQGYYEGKSVIAIAPGSNGGLAIKSVFSGGERTTLYSYDSARISIPKLGFGKTITEAIRWPPISEADPTPVIQAPKPEPLTVQAVQRMLTSSVLGGVIVGGMAERGEVVLVTLKALHSEDVTQLEKRLRAALIAYEMETPPIWTNNSYHLRLLVKTRRADSEKSIKYSAYQVQQEMQRMNHPMVYVAGVLEQNGAYLATLQVLDQTSVESIISRLKVNSDLLMEAQLVREYVSFERPKLRIVELRVRVR